METKFTKGPWKLDDESMAHVVDETYHAIAAGDGCHPDGFGLTGLMSIEDAQLIAAAPELLEAAEYAYMAILKLHPIGVWRINHQAVYAKLRDAIAKATDNDPETVQNHYEAKARGEQA